jgi:two-component system, cell cycle sensor histidine kinase and response regulator CckA
MKAVKGALRSLSSTVRHAIERRAYRRTLRAHELHVSEDRFRLLADHIKEAFMILEMSSGRAIYRSRMWAEIFGPQVPDLSYNDFEWWLSKIDPEDRPTVVSNFSALQAGETVSATFRVHPPDLSSRWVRGRGFAVLDQWQHPYHLVCLFEDITQMRQTEEQLRHAQRMEAVGSLAGGVAHDFNNLLVVIQGYAELIARDLGSSHRSQTDLGEILAAARRAAALTSQLLAFSRRQILQPQILDLNDVLRRVELMLRRVIGEDITLSMRLSDPLGRVNADPGQLEQVVMNLAVNARDAMPDGGRLTIETADVELDEAYAAQHPGATTGRQVMVAVSDTGIGMDEETRRRLFEPFFTTKPAGRGTGLGLATVYGIVKQSKGSIWVYSEPGKGTTFKIYLPAVGGAATPVTAPPVDVPALVGTETVLLVEDQVEVRGLIEKTLGRAGYRVLAASDGAEALGVARVHDGPIHVLLTDVVLPGKSGREIAREILTVRDDVRVLYMSGYTDDAIVRHGVLEAGLAFIQKPFAGSGLLHKVREVLSAEVPPRS